MLQTLSLEVQKSGRESEHTAQSSADVSVSGTTPQLLQCFHFVDPGLLLIRTRHLAKTTVQVLNYTTLDTYDQ